MNAMYLPLPGLSRCMRDTVPYGADIFFTLCIMVVFPLPEGAVMMKMFPISNNTHAE